MEEPYRPMQCEACGHQLNTYRPPEPQAGERAAAWVANTVASWIFPAAILCGVVIWGVVGGRVGVPAGSARV